MDIVDTYFPNTDSEEPTVQATPKDPNELHKASKESREALLKLLETIQDEKEKAATTPSKLKEICNAFIGFLTDKPNAPKTWQERMGKTGREFDYHQVLIPEEFANPMQEDAANIEDMRDQIGNEPFMALEHFLLTRNHFVITNDHIESIECPKPILMLESHEEDRDMDWDCTFTLFADGSYQAYNLEQSQEESVELNSEELIETFGPLISRMSLRIPSEGDDYGHLTA
jgi:hypothetical protein